MLKSSLNFLKIRDACKGPIWKSTSNILSGVVSWVRIPYSTEIISFTFSWAALVNMITSFGYVLTIDQMAVKPDRRFQYLRFLPM